MAHFDEMGNLYPNTNPYPPKPITDLNKATFTPLTKREQFALALTAAYIANGDTTYAVPLGIAAADKLIKDLSKPV